MPEPTTVAEEIAGRDRPYELRGPEPAVTEAEPPTVMPEVNVTASRMAPRPAAPAAPAGPFAGLDLKDTGPLTERYLANIDQQKARAEQRATALRPQFEDVRRSLDEMSANLFKTVGSLQPPETPPVPVLTFHDFLAPTKNETPENAIGKVIQALGLIGGGFRGMMRGDATTALAGMKGALEGWQAGDTDRAAREFKTWEAASKRIEENWQRNVTAVDKWMNAANLTLQQKLEGVKLAVLESGLIMEPLKLEQEGLKAILSEYDRANHWVLQYAGVRERTEQMRAIAEMNDTRKREYGEERLRQYDRGLDLKEMWNRMFLGPFAQGGAAGGGGGVPLMISMEAERRRNGLQPQRMPIPAAEAAVIAEWARQIQAGGGGVMDQEGRRLLREQAQTEIKRLGTLIGNSLPRRLAFEQHLKVATALRERLGDAWLPALNKLMQAGMKQTGDPLPDAVHSAIESVVREYSLAITGSNQTTVSSTDHARRMMNMLQSGLQFNAVADVMEKELAGAVFGWHQAQEVFLKALRDVDAPGPVLGPKPTGDVLKRSSAEYKRLTGAKDKHGLDMSEAQIMQQWPVKIVD